MVIEKSADGRLELRACDHQLLLPTYVGMTKKVPEYKDFLIGTDIMTVVAEGRRAIVRGYPEAAGCLQIERVIGLRGCLTAPLSLSVFPL